RSIALLQSLRILATRPDTWVPVPLAGVIPATQEPVWPGSSATRQRPASLPAGRAQAKLGQLNEVEPEHHSCLHHYTLHLLAPPASRGQRAAPGAAPATPSPPHG